MRQAKVDTLSIQQKAINPKRQESFVLTEQEYRDRMLDRRFPILRQILDEKPNPRHVFGYSSHSYNTFDEIGKLISVTSLVNENVDEILNSTASLELSRKLYEELSKLAQEIGTAISYFESEMAQIMRLREKLEVAGVSETA